MERIFTLIILFFLFLKLQAQVVLQLKQLPSNTRRDARFSIICEQNNWNATTDSAYYFKKVKNNWVLNLPAITDTFYFKITRCSNLGIEADSAFNEIDNRIIYPKQIGKIDLKVSNWIDFKKEHSATDNVEVVTDSFYSKNLGYSKKIWIYLPNDYYKDKLKRFPVIYALQGQNAFDNYTADATEWRIDETLRNLQFKNDNGCIVVAIENNKKLTDRETDYFYKGFLKSDISLAMDFEGFIVNELRKYIDSAYKTKKYREYNAIVGAGKYASFALAVALSNQFSFSKVGMFSPVFANKDSLFSLYVDEKRNWSMKVFITIGSNDTIAKPEVVDDLVSHLLEKCDFFDSEVNIVPKAKGNHNETFWASMFKPAYLWLFEGANYPNTDSKFYVNYYNDREITAKVYPNPATTNISIETDAPTIKIIDEHGNFIKDVPIALPNRISFANRGITINKVEVKKVDLNISDLKRGNYYVVFTDNSIQKSISRTLIVQ
jgi:predicted alpha/beta superfamily hydrolase